MVKKKIKPESDSLGRSIRSAKTAQELKTIVAKMKPAERVALAEMITAATERITGA